MTKRLALGRWADIPYAGEQRVPPPAEPKAGSWPTFVLQRAAPGLFVTESGAPIRWRLLAPKRIDFAGDQLQAVQRTLGSLTPEQITQADYWNAGPPTKQITPIVDRLIDTYDLSPPRASRVLTAVHAGLNDATVVTWSLKYRWQVPRPNQLDPNLATIVCTPYHPSYPAGHAVGAGCMETILSYFFPPEANRLRDLAEECSRSRVYAGVHYPADVEQGLILGRQIGEFVVASVRRHGDREQGAVDVPVQTDRHANLAPPPYHQVIPYPRKRSCHSKLDPRADPSAE